MSEQAESKNQPQLGIGSLVTHPEFGIGRVMGYEGESYVLLFKGGQARRVAFYYAGLTATSQTGDAELDRIKQAVAEVLGDYGWLEAELEMSGRWLGGSIDLIPGKEGTQPKKIPIEDFFKKIVGIRDKLRVLEQKINSHPALSSEDKLDLQGYVTRCYGSLTTFNVLFGSKEGSFKGTGKAGEE